MEREAHARAMLLDDDRSLPISAPASETAAVRADLAADTNTGLAAAPERVALITALGAGTLLTTPNVQMGRALAGADRSYHGNAAVKEPIHGITTRSQN